MVHYMAAYDEVADAYRRTFDVDTDPVLADMVGAVRGKRVLVAACGQGRDARILADLGARVEGVDVSEKMLDYAREHERTQPRGIRYTQGDAQDLAGFSETDFDGVVCRMALMDIPGLTPTITSFARVLRPGGFLVLSIVHPCFAPHVEAVSDYLTEERYEKVGGPDWLPPQAYHRPLSLYVNTLVQAGFIVSRMVEPADSPDAKGVPNILYIRCTAS